MNWQKAILESKKGTATRIIKGKNGKNMRMKTQAGLMMMMMAMASSFNNGFGDIHQPPTKEEMDKKRAIALKARNLKQGINEYFYGVKVIYARNKKNADRKARKQGLII